MIHLEHKKAEAQWFESFAPALAVERLDVSTDAKFRAMKALKASCLRELRNGVTKIWQVPDLWYGKRIDYRYQRQDFSVDGEAAPLEVFYPNLRSKRRAVGRFTRSGQSAMLGLWLALRGRFPGAEARLLSPQVYFESSRVLGSLSVACSDTGRIGLLDSSTLVTDPLRYVADVELDALVVDTTAWDLSSPDIQRIIDWADAQRLPLFAVRSHLKLDCLGAEYGLLGSVVLLSDEDEAIGTAVVESLSLGGLLAVHEDLYPFLWDPEFLRLTAARTERIRSTTRAIVGALEPFLAARSERLRIERFGHDLFFIVYYRGGSAHCPDAFVELARAAHVPARYCDSFGFDFPSLTNVILRHEDTGECSLRICSGDDPHRSDAIAALLRRYLDLPGLGRGQDVTPARRA